MEQELRRLCEPGAVSRQDAEAFLQRFPLDAIAGALQGGQLDPQLAADALSKLLDAGVAPPGLLDHALLALGTPAPALRRLGARQLAALLQAGDGRESQAQEAALRLLQCLADPDTGVAGEAARALEALAKGPAGLQAVLGSEAARQQLQQLSAAADPTVRLRGLSLAVSLAGASPDAAAAVQQQGLLQPLAAELGNTQDPLGCLAALQLVAALAQQGAGGAALAAAGLLPPLASLAQQPDALLRGEALQALGAILAAVTAAGAPDPPMGADSSQSLQSFTLNAVERALSDAPEAEAEAEGAAYAVVAQVAASPTGAELLASRGGLLASVAERAFAVTGESRQHVAAMHALAALLGAGRPAGALLLSGQAEAAVQARVFAGSGRRAPAEVLWARLRQPFAELRLATYGLLRPLCGREWGAREACSCAALLDHLCDAKSEASAEACHARFACVQALAQTAGGVVLRGVQPESDPLAALFPRLEAAARQGPFGAGVSLPPAVATGTG